MTSQDWGALVCVLVATFGGLLMMTASGRRDTNGRLGGLAELQVLFGAVVNLAAILCALVLVLGDQLTATLTPDPFFKIFGLIAAPSWVAVWIGRMSNRRDARAEGSIAFLDAEWDKSIARAHELDDELWAAREALATAKAERDAARQVLIDAHGELKASRRRMAHAIALATLEATDLAFERDTLQQQVQAMLLAHAAAEGTSPDPGRAN